jgi:hypothetical protein
VLQFAAGGSEHNLQNLFVRLWTIYTPAFKTPSSNGKIIITMKLKDEHRFHAAAMLF